MQDTSPLRRQIEAEGSRVDWESSGYHCLMLRNTLAAWCGYVSVPRDHPWHGLKERTRVSLLPEDGARRAVCLPVVSLLLEAMEQPRDDGRHPLDIVVVPPRDNRRPMDLVVLVHGGITFSGWRARLPVEEHSKLWTFGFDCSHSGDLVPGIHEARPLLGLALADDVYRDRDYVFAEVSRLAAQLRIVHERGYR